MALAIFIGVQLGQRGRVPQPSCSDYSDLTEQVRKLIGAGEIGYAQRLVDGVLNNQTQPICPSAKVALAGLRYNAAITEALTLQRSTVGAVDSGHQATLKFLEAERFADQYGVPVEQRVAPMTVFTQSYNAGTWELARASFLTAWQRGSVNQLNLQAVDSYYATLFNMGTELTNGDGEARAKGLVLVRTAEQIAKAYALPRLEARERLIRDLGSDETTWPAPSPDDPVLVASSKK